MIKGKNFHKGIEMFQYLNLHPKGKNVGDCVKRAFALLTGESYHEVSLALNRLKKETGA